MITLITILALVAAVALVLVVLIQKPKGGGIANNFAGANQIFGVKRTSEGVERFTWYISGALAVLLLLASGFNTKNVEGVEAEGAINKDIERAQENAPATTAPAPNQMNFDPNQMQQGPAPEENPAPVPE